MAFGCAVDLDGPLPTKISRPVPEKLPPATRKSPRISSRPPRSTSTSWIRNVKPGVGGVDVISVPLT